MRARHRHVREDRHVREAIGQGAGGEAGRDSGREPMEFPAMTPCFTPRLATAPPEGGARDRLPWWGRVATPPTTLSFLSFLCAGAERSGALLWLAEHDRGR